MFFSISTTLKPFRRKSGSVTADHIIIAVDKLTLSISPLAGRKRSMPRLS
jgi:hypothetical protein